MKKGVKIFILIILIAIVLFLIFGLKPVINYFQVKYAKIEITLKDDLTIKFTEEKHVSDFITSINGKIVDDYIIDSTKIGEKEVKFEFVNDDGIKVPYKYTIKIIDDIPPVIWLNNSYSITVGNNVDLVSKILCGDNEDGNPKRTIEGEYDYNTVGSYPLVFKATDRSGNTTEKKFTLNVKEKQPNTPKPDTPKTYTYFSDVVKNYKTEKTKIGIDVSGWQGDIDFEAIKNAGVEFIIIKVGSTKGIGGEYLTDSKFANNIKKANEYGIDVGVYFYSYANSVESAKKDAEFVLNKIKGYDVSLPIAFDWEDWNSFNKYELSFWELTNVANTFLDTVSEAGYSGMLYSSKSYLEKVWMKTEYDIWLAHYTKRTNYEGKYTYWQLCSDGKIDGINGEVDIDIMYID